nr:probable trehalose-phosphate phosphatase C [Bactrocera oleae]XP_014089126.1 probable trehalose-phosphate phosphatase C [Bactrocera oleae]XP_014089127.1 probable trehalose-phosphate phosphatase C [Bactrocera oleae]XP_014089128.1 probable trehalose-phosphate phosphatase C [Bactrocera oleae]XP_036222823.1 probable trehalose-phosphate phosphatase C [Bactrocera oleae]XP_036222825.1 probable trehalose-phosphate phosphatase C [Bactrocera oleae]
MPEKRVVPVIGSLADFESKLPGYLNTNTPLALLLDYDGTLVGIADNPANTFLTASMKKLLHQLAVHPKVFLALISGRGLRDVQSCLGIKGITYAGNHGLEIESGDGTRYDYALPAELQTRYMTIVRELTEKLENNGAWVEDKKVSLTFHYRDVPGDSAEEYKQAAKAIIESHGFRANQAHMAIEAKPPVNWNKGEAALLILKNQFGDDWAKKIKVIFAGDDNTDEDAMRLLQGSGLSFRVSTDPNIQTYADFRLASQSVVEGMMTWISNTYNQ